MRRSIHIHKSGHFGNPKIGAEVSGSPKINVFKGNPGW